MVSQAADLTSGRSRYQHRCTQSWCRVWYSLCNWSVEVRSGPAYAKGSLVGIYSVRLRAVVTPLVAFTLGGRRSFCFIGLSGIHGPLWRHGRL